MSSPGMGALELWFTAWCGLYTPFCVSLPRLLGKRDDHCTRWFG
jgi:hypothetical protein